MHAPEGLKAFLRRVELGEPATFLLDQIVFDATNAFRCGKDAFPVGNTFTKKHGVAPIRTRGPLFAMNGFDSSRVGANPAYRVRARFQARPYVELQNDRRLRILRQYFDRSLTFDWSKFQLVIVVSRLQARRFELVGRGIQGVGDFLPSIQTWFGLRT